ncbi:SMC-Scp complex subunit ScpB [Aporhodopirellula aestuarii]|uniref:SMC-Scp complex subunit ScpB n=1 Tax=Aporhodopirellula aestuarii TaxID=2950107 RepID=A0ABT0U938_9BACT|nr:SMC-Scp complex subunit ScpB [Aporhodopirellula aestuarii]MCM2373209.1 SMC-Scp complex subunit ScpB [Aporhodopirellula aestuarii]
MTPYGAPWQRAITTGRELDSPYDQRALTLRAVAERIGKKKSASEFGLSLLSGDALGGQTVRVVADKSDGDRGSDPLDPAIARSRVEALLLIAKSPLNYRKIASLAGLEDATQARTLVAELNELYDSLGRGFRIEQLAGGSRMVTRSVVAPWLRRLGVLAPAIRLSWPMMETLAVVAYRQDVTRADVESVRGVACGEILRQLMQLDLVRISGRSEDLGRPYLYGTTKRFLKICGLASINALPAIDSRGFCDDVSGSQDVADVRDNSENSPSHETADPAASQVPKESDVSLAVTDALATDLVLSAFTTGISDAAGESMDADASMSAAGAVNDGAPVAVIEDEEDDLFEKGLDDDDDEDYVDDDDDWDDDDDDDEDDEDDEDDDEEEDDLDVEDDVDDSWEEVDDDDADEDWDDDDDDDEDDDWDEDDDDDDDI